METHKRPKLTNVHTQWNCCDTCCVCTKKSDIYKSKVQVEGWWTNVYCGLGGRLSMKTLIFFPFFSIDVEGYCNILAESYASAAIWKSTVNVVKSFTTKRGLLCKLNNVVVIPAKSILKIWSKKGILRTSRDTCL